MMIYDNIQKTIIIQNSFNFKNDTSLHSYNSTILWLIPEVLNVISYQGGLVWCASLQLGGG